jgi:Flp pilus assembly protein TadG
MWPLPGRLTRNEGGGTSGSVAMEFGLMVPFLAIMIAGIADVGSAAYRSMQVQAAAEAGAIYASQHEFDAAGISAAVTNAVGTASGITAPTPTLFRGCPAAGGVTVITCTTTCQCPNGSQAGQYVRVTAQVHYTPLFADVGLPTTISGEAVVRIN